jgi:hypothetical protein
MSWAEIKSALNSTLGTPNFKALDQLIKDTVTELAETSKIWTYDTPGTYTWQRPPGVGTVEVTIVGAGGGGASGGYYSGGGGGGAGFINTRILDVSGFDSVQVTVGAGGAGAAGGSGNRGATAGSTGGTSSFGSLLSVSGGRGGASSSSNSGGQGGWGSCGGNSGQCAPGLTPAYGISGEDAIWAGFQKTAGIAGSSGTAASSGATVIKSGVGGKLFAVNPLGISAASYCSGGNGSDGYTSTGYSSSKASDGLPGYVYIRAI